MANNAHVYTQNWKKDENGTILIPDEVLLEGAITETKLDLVFSPLGGRQSQPKHKGDKMVKRVKIKVLHPDNRLDNGLNTNAASFMTNRWFAYDANNVQTGNPDGYATQAEAQAAGVSGNEMSGVGTCYYGDADFNTVTDGIPELGSVGGNVNAVNVASKYIYGTVKRRGIQAEWNKTDIGKDNRKMLLMETSESLVETVRDLREAEIQRLLLDAASANVVFPAGAASVAMNTLTSQDELTYETLVNWELKMKKARVPLTTKMQFGTTKVDTLTLDSAWVVYIASEQVQTLRNMRDANNNSVFTPSHQYGSAKVPLKHEVGQVGRFRFVEVFNMQKWKGAGAAVGVATGAGQADEFSAYSTDVAGTQHYDVFPTLFVGMDAFDVIDYSADNMTLKTHMPKVSDTDRYGDIGVMSIAYWVGMLILKPERLSVVKSVVRN